MLSAEGEISVSREDGVTVSHESEIRVSGKGTMRVSFIANALLARLQKNTITAHCRVLQKNIPQSYISWPASL